jgi:hypothetical protein
LKATGGLCTIISLAVLALLAVGCDDGGDDSELAAEYADASADELADPDDDDEFALRSPTPPASCLS